MFLILKSYFLYLEKIRFEYLTSYLFHMIAIDKQTLSNVWFKNPSSKPTENQQKIIFSENVESKKLQSFLE
ncbi:hypothetical protein BpHYR1_021169 [Brachionus plicatilis]|uniref:Uncharacterized protein n=1 Tax=Brachionus plicatilis TaxID=10195 RepID=A0A3M7PKK3_BRAPC|nr:hypothetical protein BpHYR1_021169 [Brachionus plicatilis]